MRIKITNREKDYLRYRTQKVLEAVRSRATPVQPGPVAIKVTNYTVNGSHTGFISQENKLHHALHIFIRHVRHQQPITEEILRSEYSFAFPISPLRFLPDELNQSNFQQLHPFIKSLRNSSNCDGRGNNSDSVLYDDIERDCFKLNYKYMFNDHMIIDQFNDHWLPSAVTTHNFKFFSAEGMFNFKAQYSYVK